MTNTAIKTGYSTVDGTTTSKAWSEVIGNDNQQTFWAIEFGNITSLTGTLAITVNGQSIDVPLKSPDGTLVAAGGTITAVDGKKFYFVTPCHVTNITFTRTAGSGPVALWSGVSADELLLAMFATGVPISSLPGVSNHFFIPDATDENLISASARKVYGIQIFHIDATPVYVKLYDKATAASEADTPIYSIGVPANSTAANGSAFSVEFSLPIALTLGLAVRAVTGLADNSDAALTAAENLINIQWSA